MNSKEKSLDAFGDYHLYFVGQSFEEIKNSN